MGIFFRKPSLNLQLGLCWKSTSQCNASSEMSGYNTKIGQAHGGLLLQAANKYSIFLVMGSFLFNLKALLSFQWLSLCWILKPVTSNNYFPKMYLKIVFMLQCSSIKMLSIVTSTCLKTNCDATFSVISSPMIAVYYLWCMTNYFLLLPQLRRWKWDS